jgi:hypothetical protein
MGKSPVNKNKKASKPAWLLAFANFYLWEKFGKNFFLDFPQFRASPSSSVLSPPLSLEHITLNISRC